MDKIHPWAEPICLPGTGPPVVLVHGLSGSPSEMRPLAEFLASHGYHVIAPLLPGHGTTLSDLQRTGWQDWYRAVAGVVHRAAAKEDGVMPVAVGLSTGALLALHGARQGLFSGVAALAAPMVFRHPVAEMAPLLQYMIRYLPKRKSLYHTELERISRRFAYDRQPTRSVAELLKLRRLVWRELPLITVPVLLVNSLADRQVHPVSAGKLAARLGDRVMEQVILYHSVHQVTLDIEKHLVEQAVLRLCQRVFGVEGRFENLHESGTPLE